MSKFAKVPMAAITDNRLTPRQFKVLCALFLFADTNGKCHPKRSQLSELCGTTDNHISVATAQLSELGWIEKTGNGGRSSSMDYTVFTSPKSVRVNEQKTSPKSVRVKHDKPVPDQDGLEQINPYRISTKTRTESVQAPRTESVRGIQQTISTDQQQTSTTVAKHDLQPVAKTAVSAKAKKPPLPPEFQLACCNTWAAYAAGYQTRYGVEPVRNAKVNQNVVDLVKRLGYEESPLVASYYLTHSGSWYIRAAHSVGALLADAEKLRMEWATNRRITSSSARHEDKKQAAGAAVSDYLQTLEGRYAS